MSRFRFRRFFEKLGPAWLTSTEHEGGKLLYSVGLLFDVCTERLRQGRQAKLPDFAPDDAVPRIGQDRRIVRGFDEPRASYNVRLKRWLDDWQKAGSRRAIAAQLQGWLTPHAPLVRVVNATATWTSRASDGTVTERITWPSPNWDWDSRESLWSRVFVLIYPPTDLWETDGEWGDPGTWGDGGTWGTTATPNQVATTKAIARDWKSGIAVVKKIIIAFDPDSFDPEGVPGAPLPDGTWALNGKNVGGDYVFARDRSARYWGGVA